MPPQSAAHSPPLRGRREHRKHVTRRELLAAGRKLFGERGLYEARIDDLTRQAGVAKGTLYGYFANKEDLIEAVVTSGLSELLGHAHREAQKARTHAQVADRLIAAHLQFFQENPDLMRIFHQVRGLLKFNPAGSERLRRALANYLRGLAGLLALHHPRARGHGRAELATATMIFGAVSGLASIWTALEGRLPDDVRARAAIRALVAMALAFEAGAVENRAPARRAPAAGAGRGARPARIRA
jgi:AcrR family transcriptional regulator